MSSNKIEADFSAYMKRAGSPQPEGSNKENNRYSIGKATKND